MRVIVITGGSSGIGRAVAALFGRNGWRIGLIARGIEGLRATQAEIEALGARCAFVVADVADDDALDRAAGDIETRLGPIDVWVNCAGNGVFGRFLDVTDAEFRRVTDVTYGGTVNGTRAALRRMRPRDRGTVINICSGVAFHGMPLLSSYSGAKHAVRGFGEAVRSELQQENSRVLVSTVFPPAVNTPFFAHAASHLERPPRPADPVYQPEVVARAVLRVAEKPRREAWISGTTVLFALANRVSGRMMDRVIGLLGYDGQVTTSFRAARDRDPTLFVPSAKPGSVHGAFGKKARRFSTQVWALGHPRTAAALVAGVCGFGFGFLFRRFRKKR